MNYKYLIIILPFIFITCKKETITTIESEIYTYNLCTPYLLNSYDSLVYVNQDCSAPHPLTNEREFNIDLDGDNIEDVSFRASHTTPFASPYENCNSFNVYFQARQIGSSNSQFTVVSNLNNQELLFDYGDNILVSYNWHLIGSFSSETPDGEGNFTFDGIKYLGVRKAKNNAFYYGYIKIEKHDLDVWIHGWAISKLPDTPLFAGQAE